MTETNERNCPSEVLDWIAWYPEQNVPERIRHLIESHAAECLACRSEIDAITDAASDPDLAVPDPEALWQRVLAQIEDPADRSPLDVEPLKLRERPPGRRRTIWAASRRSAVAAGLAITLTAGLIGAAAARLSDTGQAEGNYVTATEPQPAVPTDVVQLDVVFRPEVRFGRVQKALEKAGATLVNGPSRGGVLRLILPAGTDPKRAAEQLREGPDAVALFAEPVVP